MANLSWNEIQDRAVEFSSKWAGETYERGESQREAGLALREAVGRLADIDKLRARRDELRNRILGDAALRQLDSGFGTLAEWQLLTRRYAYDSSLHSSMLAIEEDEASRLNSHPRSNEYHTLASELERYARIDDHRPVYILDANSQEAGQVIDALNSLGNLYERATSLQPPYQDYQDNTDEVWSYVPHTDVLRYLDEKPFADTQPLTDSKHGAAVRIQSAEGGDSLEAPTSLIISAMGFDSWRGRAGSDKYYNSKYGRGSSNSIEVMKHYAALDTPIPPVDTVHVYIQPDGRVFADNGSGDSHRLGAAYLRGDRTITAQAIELHLLGDGSI